MKLEDFVEGEAYHYEDIATSAGYSPLPGGNFVRGIVPAPREAPRVITIKINRTKTLYSDTYREGCKVFEYIGDGLPSEGDQQLVLGNRTMFYNRDMPIMLFLRKEGESKRDPWWFEGVWRIAGCRYVEDEQSVISDGRFQRVFRFTLKSIASSLRHLPVSNRGDYILTGPLSQLLNETDYVRATEATLQLIMPVHRKLANRFYKWLMGRGCREVFLEDEGIDIQFRSAERSYMAELKVVNKTSPRMSIREALGQVFEYNYYQDNMPFDEWLIVLDRKPLLADKQYVRRLNEELDLPLNMGWQAREDFLFVRPL